MKGVVIVVRGCCGCRKGLFFNTIITNHDNHDNHE